MRAIRDRACISKYYQIALRVLRLLCTTQILYLYSESVSHEKEYKKERVYIRERAQRRGAVAAERRSRLISVYLPSLHKSFAFSFARALSLLHCLSLSLSRSLSRSALYVHIARPSLYACSCVSVCLLAPLSLTRDLALFARVYCLCSISPSSSLRARRARAFSFVAAAFPSLSPPLLSRKRVHGYFIDEVQCLE